MTHFQILIVMLALAIGAVIMVAVVVVLDLKRERRDASDKAQYQCGSPKAYTISGSKR